MHHPASTAFDEVSFDLNLTNFDFAFTLSFTDTANHTYERLNIEKYYSFEFRKLNAKYVTNNATGERVLQRTPETIPFEKCPEGRFNNDSTANATYGMIGVWYCL
jgi:hypothetical protein